MPVSLRDRLASGTFTVTAEIGLPRGAATDSVTKVAGVLRGWVDAVNITDNPGASVRLASWAGSLAALAAGVEPVMQMTCRDRNRAALQSDVLGAAAFGIRNVLVMTGDPPHDAQGVFDIDSVRLLAALRVMRDEGELMSGQRLDPAPDCFLGAVENPFAPGGTARLGEKIAAGAQFVQTQFVFDIPAFVRWMKEVRDLGLHQRCHILAGVGVVRSLRALDFIRDHVRGTHVPDEVYGRLRGAAEDGIAGEGERLAAETVRRLREIDGVAGVHLLAAGNEDAVPSILEAAGIGAGHAS